VTEAELRCEPESKSAATQSKPGGTKSKSGATKSKENAMKSKENAMKSKNRFSGRRSSLVKGLRAFSCHLASMGDRYSLFLLSLGS
jgi:hypothetical protein